MHDSDQVNTPDQAREAVRAALKSAEAGRTVRVAFEDLDAYFDSLKAEALRDLGSRAAG